MLELEGLTRRFGPTLALDGLSLTVPDGRLVGFVGANGAGKTTAMRITLGVLRADAGEVRWEGRPITQQDRTGFGYLPEERGLYPKMRVLDQVEHFARLRGVPGGEAGRRAQAALEHVGLAERGQDRTEALSLGNQQRVQLAVALVHDPTLLVLDEPFSGLDPVGVDVLADVLRARADAGVPVLFSSHQLELVERLCDAVAIVRDGRVVAQGDVEELRRSGARRLRVGGGAPGTAWAARLAGVRVVREEAGDVLLELDDGADDQAVLDAARAAGPVHHFAPVERRLSELFRETLAA